MLTNVDFGSALLLLRNEKVQLTADELYEFTTSFSVTYIYQYDNM